MVGGVWNGRTTAIQRGVKANKDSLYSFWILAHAINSNQLRGMDTLCRWEELGSLRWLNRPLAYPSVLFSV